MNGAMWLFIVVAVAGIGIFYFHRQGKIAWDISQLRDVLKGIKMLVKRIKMPALFRRDTGSLTERLRTQTKKEVAKAEELKTVLEAKTELAKARAENTKLRKEIAGVSERSVEKEKRVVEKDKLAMENAKPRRL